MKPVFIEATTIPDAWFQCLYTLIEESQKPDGAVRRYTVETGSNPGADRIEFDMADYPYKAARGPTILPQIPEHLNFPLSWTRNISQITCHIFCRPKKRRRALYLRGAAADSWQYVIDYYKKHGSRTNRMCMEVGRPEDIFFYNDEHGSTPCLRLGRYPRLWTESSTG